MKLSEAEAQLMKSILPEDYFKKVFDLIVNIPLDSIKHDSEKFVKHCKECKGKNLLLTTSTNYEKIGKYHNFRSYSTDSV